MGLINAVGNLGGYFGPLAVGFLNHHTGNFRYGFGLLSLGYLAGAGLTLLLPRQARAREQSNLGKAET
jgi:ACS family tartrate transporter-like MFS transporter